MLSIFHARLKRTLVFYVGLSIIYPVMPGYFFYNSSVVLPIFYYADLVWGDKDNVTLMKELQILQNKAAKLILDRSLHSSSTDALTVLRWPNLEERRKCHRCMYAYKYINGEINHSLDIVRKSDMHSYNTRNNDTIKLPKIKS